MSDHAIAAPSRKLDEFEELVFQYTGRMGHGNEEVCTAAPPTVYSYTTLGRRRPQLRPPLRISKPRPPARVSFLFTITPALSNMMGNLHGGCAATLIDVLSTTILLGVSEPGKFAYGGVSRNLKVTYLRPVPTGSEVRLVCEVIHVGKRLALLRAEIQRAENGDICVVGEHEKANTDPEVTQRI
ncbi:hypothetical protein N7485_012547 [Penicillium canescens]|nr:hypothetical protein N7485_012547 [Penicillium canescens]